MSLLLRIKLLRDPEGFRCCRLRRPTGQADGNLACRFEAPTYLKPLASALDKAKESGDEKKIARLVLTVKMATDVVNAAPPDKKLKVMEGLLQLGSRTQPA